MLIVSKIHQSRAIELVIRIVETKLMEVEVLVEDVVIKVELIKAVEMLVGGKQLGEIITVIAMGLISLKNSQETRTRLIFSISVSLKVEVYLYSLNLIRLRLINKITIL